MKLSAPKVVTWWIALILAVLGLLGFLGVVTAIAPYAFWLALIAAALLLIATQMKGL
jgi:4-hydroxybenzoate polyprenyltransferase